MGRTARRRWRAGDGVVGVPFLISSTVAIALLAALSGCGQAAGARAADGRLRVAAAFYPLEYVAEQVGAGHVDVTSLTKPGAEPHDLELSPQQVGEIESAGLVVYEKGFQPAVDEAVAQNRDGPVVEAGRVVRLEHNDPHFWQDPTRLALLATTVGNALAAADPGHASAYRHNAATLTRRLSALDATMRDGLQSCARRVFVTSHAAFGYLARRYGLQMVGISGLAPDAEPSPARVRDVQDVIRRHHVTTVFSETLVSPKLARTLARDLGVRAAVLDPIEGLAPDAAPGSSYLTVMRANLRALQRANGCT